MVSVSGLPVAIAVNGSVCKSNADKISKVPPTKLPPEISTIPSLFISAYKPALVMSASKLPIVVELFTVIVVSSLFEFLITTVWFPVIAIPFPRSFNKVDESATVDDTTTVCRDKLPVICDFE